MMLKESIRSNILSGYTFYYGSAYFHPKVWLLEFCNNKSFGKLEFCNKSSVTRSYFLAVGELLKIGKKSLSLKMIVNRVKTIGAFPRVNKSAKGKTEGIRANMQRF